MSQTPAPPPIGDDLDDGIDETTRAEMRSLLDTLAATTQVSPDAWEDFEARRATQPTGWRPTRGVFLAVAAVMVVVLGVTAALLQDDGDGGDRVETGDDEDTTTTRQTRRRPTTTSTTPSRSSTTAAQSAPQEGDTDPGRASATTAPPGGQGTTTSTTAPDLPDAGRATPALAQQASGGEYTVELIWDGDTMFFRRTDDVGTAVPGDPDGYGHVESAGWGPVGAAGCLASSGQEYSFPDAATHAFTWGVLGPDIASVEVVMTDGARRSARIGGVTAGGVRPWIVERPLGTVQRIDGRDAGGQVVASITEMTGDWGSAGC